MILFTDDFYKAVILKALNKNIIKKNMKILIAAGGQKDFNKFKSLDFINVTITNVDERMNKESFLPYKWDYMDVENLKYPDGEFDFCIIHHGLHHCASPHRGLLELYRVCRNGLIVFEGIDNFITRLGVLIGAGEDYELAAVKNNNFKYGGFLNTGIPNFVYRWTEKEIFKVLSCYEPSVKPSLKYYYGLELPFKRLKDRMNKMPFIIALISLPFLYLLSTAFGRSLCNRFGFLVLKQSPGKNIFPWLKYEKGNLAPDTDYIGRIIK